MSFRVDKNLKISDELIAFCCRQGFRHYKTQIDFEKDLTQIKISASGSEISEEKLRYLNKILNVERQPELEQQYWGLGGDSSLYEESELSLVGMMVDRTEISSDNDTLNIIVTRKEEL